MLPFLGEIEAFQILERPRDCAAQGSPPSLAEDPARVSRQSADQRQLTTIPRGFRDGTSCLVTSCDVRSPFPALRSQTASNLLDSNRFFRIPRAATDTAWRGIERANGSRPNNRLVPTFAPAYSA